MSIDFLLVHGGWHDGSCWDETAGHLEAAGHRAFAPTMAGHGAEGGQAATISDCVGSVAGYIADRELEDFVLVGHSIAGLVICKLAELMPERIRRLVFLDAYVLNDGESVFDLLPEPMQQMLDGLRAESPTATISLDFETFHGLFINDADEPTARTAFARLCPGTINRQFEKMDLKVFHRLDIPTSFIHCTDDVTMATADWRWHPDMTGRLKHPRVVEIPGSHEVFFSDPKRLADALIDAAAAEDTGN